MQRWWNYSETEEQKCEGKACFSATYISSRQVKNWTWTSAVNYRRLAV